MKKKPTRLPIQKPPEIRALVLISDLHLGSIRAILQPNFETEEAQIIGQTPLSKWFYECWQDSHSWLSSILNPKEYAVIFNGDLIEGNHHRTTEIWSPDAGQHAKAAKELIEPVCKRAGKTYFVVGTECHVGSSENSIARAVGGEINAEHGQPNWMNLRMTMCGRNISIRHHFPATGRSYLEASQYSIQLGNAVNEASRAGWPIPDIIIGAHRHRPGHFIDGNRLALVTSAWQGLTKHGHKVVPDGIACPSIYILDWRGVPDGDLPVIHFRKYNPPAPARVTP